MALPIPSPSTSFTDTIAVFNSETLAQVFPTARPIKCSVRETSKTMEHPAETGIIIGDHRIINQTEIDIPLLINAQNYDIAYSDIKNLYLNGTLLLVQTRLTVYGNMIIVDLPDEETADMYDAVTLNLHLKEVLFVPSPSTYDPADAQNDDTIPEGQQKPSAPVVQDATAEQSARSFTSGAVTVTPPPPVSGSFSSGAVTVGSPP